MDTRRCCVCDTTKSLDEFSGTCGKCKICQNIYYRERSKQMKSPTLDIPRIAKLGETPVAGIQYPNKWLLPNLATLYPKLDIDAYFVPGGDPVEQAREAMEAAHSLAAKLIWFKVKLEAAKANGTWLECCQGGEGVIVSRKFKKGNSDFGDEE